MRKVGERVTIKKDLSDKMYDYVPEMQNFAGLEVEVLDVKTGLLARPVYILSGTKEHINWCRWYEEYFI